jgi:arginyl-tRNA---protein transferase
MPNIDRIKRQKRDKFDLLDRIHLAEYPTVQKPTSPKSGAPIEPAIKFEVNLESDSFSKEKYILPTM